jgi:hypothetical protein
VRVGATNAPGGGYGAHPAGKATNAAAKTASAAKEARYCMAVSGAGSGVRENQGDEHNAGGPKAAWPTASTGA